MFLIIPLTLDRKYSSYFMTYKFLQISTRSRITSHQYLRIYLWKHEFIDTALIKYTDSSTRVGDPISVWMRRILIVEIKQSTRFSLALEKNWFLKIVVMKSLLPPIGIECICVIVLISWGRPFYRFENVSGRRFTIDLLHPLPLRPISKLNQITNNIILLLTPLFIFSHNQI